MINLHLLFVGGEVNCCVWKQPQTGSQISFPKPSEPLILIYEKKTLPKTFLTVKSTDLTLYFNNFQRRGDSFAENPSETDAHKAL